MNHVIFLHGLTSSNRSAIDPVKDIAILDVGETETVAMINVRIPAGGDVPLKQFLHSEMLKYLTDEVRLQALQNGQIELRNGNTDTVLKDELIECNEMTGSVSDQPRATERKGAPRQRSSSDPNMTTARTGVGRVVQMSFRLAG